MGSPKRRPSKEQEDEIRMTEGLASQAKNILLKRETAIEQKETASRTGPIATLVAGLGAVLVAVIFFRRR